MDNRCDTDNSMGAWPGEQLYHGRVDSHPAGNCYCHGAAQHYSGTKSIIEDMPGIFFHDGLQKFNK